MIVLAFDTETSGLLHSALTPLDKQPEIIEFYGVMVDLATGDQGAELEQLLAPARAISDEITGITGITNEMLVGQPMFANFAHQLEQFIGNSDAVMAHNLSFDMEMVDLEFGRVKMSTTSMWPRRKICTVEKTIHLKGHRLTLQGLHEHLFGEGFPKAHRARADVQAMIKCSVELFKRGEL